MKKMMTVFGMIGWVFLSGCSLLGEVNNSLEYANTTTDYMNTAKNFANEVPQLANDAVTDEAARQQLEEEIITMKEEIKKFNEAEVPSIAEDIHNQIVSSNAKLEEGLDMYLTNIENGKLDPDLLENSEIISTVNELSSLMDQIEELGN
jgi:hypothetical protein